MSSLKDIELFLEDSERELYMDPIEDDSGSTKKADDSVDDQIDSYIIKFERDSIVSEEDSIMEALKRMSLETLLEQDSPEEEDAAPEDDDAETGGDATEPEVQDPIGSEEISATEPATPPKLPLNVDEFTKRVARLVENAEVLLSVRSVIINRAFNYLLENYDQAHVDAMKEVLDEQFDFDIDDPGRPVETPYAVGAYAGGTGGLGGGG